MQAEVFEEELGTLLGTLNEAMPRPAAEGTSLDSLARFAASSSTSLSGESGPARRQVQLLPQTTVETDGTGPVISLDGFAGKLLVATLGITEVVERTGLTVSVWGSSNQIEWGSKPVLTLRPRQYCGVYSVLLNLAARPDIRYLRVQWEMRRWGKGSRSPQFGFEVFVEESGSRVSSSAVA